MHRPLTRGVAVRSIAQSICKSKSHNKKQLQNGRRSNVAHQMRVSQPFTTTSAHEVLGYGEESAVKSMQMQIVKALHAGERSTASNILSDLVQGNYLLRADDFVYILNYCATSPDPLFVLETWRTMEDKGVGLNDMCYMLMIRALCRGGYLQEASNLMDYLGESHGLFPILPVCNSFLGACAKMQSITHANQCLDLMDHRMVGKNEVTYNEILKLAVWQQNLSAVHEIWKDYIRHYSLSIIALRKFVWSFTRLKDIKSAYETLQRMVGLAIRGRLAINRTTAGKLCSSRMDIPIPFSGELGAQKISIEESEHSVALDMGNKEFQAAKTGILSKHTNKPAMKLLRWSFNDVIHACAQTQNSKLAEQLMQQMQNLGLQPSSHTYDGFVRAVVSERGSNFGMEVLKIMKQRDLKPYDPTLATLSINYSRALELDLAEALLDQISECPYAHPHNALLAACDAMDKPERAVQILAKMKQGKIQPDIRTYELLFSLFGNVNAPYEEGNMLSQVDCAKRINAIEMDMVKNNIQHSHLSIKNLLKALGAEGMIRELMQYLRVAENLFSRNKTYLGTPIYNRVLHSLVEAKESHLAIEIFKSMKSCGVQATAATYTIMIDCCSIIGCFTSACAIVSMMLRDGFYPWTLTYTTLIKILLKFEDFDEALNLLDQASSDGVQLDVLLFDTILEKACQKGRLDVIEFVIEQMRQKKVQPDSTTCKHVFSAYVDRGFHSTAVEALQVLSLRIIGEEDSFLQEKKIDYEDFILAEDSGADTRILEFFKDSEENLAIALLNLRWSATLGFPVSWSPDQSAWTRRLSTNYNARSRTG